VGGDTHAKATGKPGMTVK